MDDLRYNHEGMLSPRQQQTLRVRRFWHVNVFAGVSWAVACLLAVVATIVEVLNDLSRSFVWENLFMLWVIILIGSEVS